MASLAVEGAEWKLSLRGSRGEVEAGKRCLGAVVSGANLSVFLIEMCGDAAPHQGGVRKQAIF